MLIVRLSSGPLNTTEKCSVLESNFDITFLGFTVFLVTLLYGKFFQAIFLEILKSRNCIMLPKKSNEILRVLQRRFMHILMMTYISSNQLKKPWRLREIHKISKSDIRYGVGLAQFSKYLFTKFEEHYKKIKKNACIINEVIKKMLFRRSLVDLFYHFKHHKTFIKFLDSYSSKAFA